MESDLVHNYDLVKEYVYCVGGSTPLPHALHHEAFKGCMVAKKHIIFVAIE